MSVVTQTKNTENGLRHFNNALTFVVIALGLYLILMPLLPQATFWIRQKTGDLSKDNHSVQLPKDDRLVIPQMGMDAQVHEGMYTNTLEKGLWHRPRTSTPDKGGNTVIVGHRFLYGSPAVFYHLDKVKENDEFNLFWKGKEYKYKVREVRVVAANQTSIESNTNEPTLTLYTCTPIWTSKNRLVVISDLVKDPS